MEPELDSIAFDNKTARPGKERVFHLPGAFGIAGREMERARRLLLSSAVRATQTTHSIAFLLSEYGLYDGDPGLFPHDVEAVLALDAEAVREAAGRLLVDSRRSVVTVVPSEPGESRDPA